MYPAASDTLPEGSMGLTVPEQALLPVARGGRGDP